MNEQTIPADFPVRVLTTEHGTGQVATCGTCGRSWDDGGQLARDILDTPGMYVAVVVWPLDHLDDGETGDPVSEPNGWAVAFRETD